MHTHTHIIILNRQDTSHFTRTKCSHVQKQLKQDYQSVQHNENDDCGVNGVAMERSLHLTSPPGMEGKILHVMVMGWACGGGGDEVWGEDGDEVWGEDGDEVWGEDGDEVWGEDGDEVWGEDGDEVWGEDGDEVWGEDGDEVGGEDGDEVGGEDGDEVGGEDTCGGHTCGVRIYVGWGAWEEVWTSKL